MQIDASPMLHHSWQWRSSVPLASETCRRFCTGPRGFKASTSRLCLGLQGFLWHQVARKWKSQGSSRYLCLACKSERRSARLFVDGDTHSISEVKEAIGMLRKKGLDVWTTVYAEPRREDNKNWGEFFKGADTSFCPVPRREDLGEANDEQMMADMRLLACSTARSATSARLAIALLTSDTDFLETVAFATGLGIDTMVLIPHRHVNTTQAYRGQGFQVMPILQRELCSPKVRAILHGDGSGSVRIGKPCSFGDYDSVFFLRFFLITYVFVFLSVTVYAK